MPISFNMYEFTEDLDVDVDPEHVVERNTEMFKEFITGLENFSNLLNKFLELEKNTSKEKTFSYSALYNLTEILFQSKTKRVFFTLFVELLSKEELSFIFENTSTRQEFLSFILNK